MTAKSVTGKGNGSAGPKVNPISNVENVLFASSAHNGQTIATNIQFVFLNFDGNFTLHLQPPEKMVGRTIVFRSRDVNGHTCTITPVYGSDYSFASGWVFMTLISDGSQWNIMNWYTDD